MKTAKILCISMVFLFFCLAPTAVGQTELDGASILKELTGRPRNTWISVGTIQATHQVHGEPKVTSETAIGIEISKAIQEYKDSADKHVLTADLLKDLLDAIPFNVRYRLANDYSMTSREVVKYDGNRFYWEINVSSRSDTVKPDASLAANTMTDEFDLAWNKQRVFCWDGEKYTTYSVSAGNATVDAAGRLGTPTVNGPLTAGLIPWGYDKFSDASLSSATVTLAKTTPASAGSIQMTITHADGSLTELTLDPSKDYAVTNATLTSVGDLVVTYTCSGYQLIAEQWVPSSVSIKRKTGSLKSDMPTTELWTDIKVTSTSAPSPSSFSTSLGLDALVEYFSPVMASSAVYVNSYETDTDDLLARRLAYGLAEGSGRQNCATASLQYVASRFGKAASNAALANLVNADGRTSLYDLKQSAGALGLYSRVVKTDLAGLQNLGAAKAILHIPGKDHFVVVDRVDDQYVWVVDLSNRKFYYRQSVHFFPLEWTGGTALLLSDRPIAGQFTTLPDDATTAIVGGQGYSCSKLLQQEGWMACLYVSGLCQSSCTYYYERWGCNYAETGTCTTSVMPRKMSSPCIPDFTTGACTITGEWFYFNMYACD